MDSKKYSLFELFYNDANNIKEDNLDICDTIDVTFLDALKNKRIKTLVNQQVTCRCVSNEFVDDFYVECDKCKGNGYLNELDNTIVCNRCLGNKMLAKNICPLCKGDMYVLDKKEMIVTLNGENDLLIENKGKTIKNRTGNLIVSINIVDRDAYIIKGKDVYSRKIIDFKKNEFEKSKEVETCVDFSKIKIVNLKYQDVLKLNGKGINGGDFYQPIRCEVKGEKGEDVYKNIILPTRKNEFYIKREDLYSSVDIIPTYDVKPLNDPNYHRIDIEKVNSFTLHKIEGLGKKGINNGDNGDLYLCVFIGDFYVYNNELYLNKCELSKTEYSSSKKSIVYCGSKISVPFDKKKTSNYFLDMGNYGLVRFKNNKKESSKLYIRIPLYENEEYFVSVKEYGFIKDYRKFFNEEVKVYSSKENLDEYIEFNGEKVVYDSYGNKVNITLKKGGK